MLRRVWQAHTNGILFLASTLISFCTLIAIVEAVENIRYFKWKAMYHEKGDLYGHLTLASPNERLIWEYRPYGKCEVKTREHNGRLVGTIKTNRYGFRDKDYGSREKHDGILRIAYVGDSVTLGLWVDSDSIFVRRFETEANRLLPGQGVQALNFGVDGYNALQICEMLQTKVLSFSPDKVVYVMCLNDYDLEEASAMKTYYFRKPKSFLLDRLKKAWHRSGRLEDQDYHLFHYNKNKEIVSSKVIEMRDVLDQHMIEFLVVIMPVFDLSENGFDTYRLSQIHDEIKDLLIDNGIRVFDLLDTFKKQGKGPQHYAYDIWHPNQEGHRVIADALLQPVLFGNLITKLDMSKP